MVGPVAACSGPGGVELGHDWAGASTFALVRVDGLVTVVGIDGERARAESLAVVPQQADDTDAVAPRLVRLGDGRWLVTVPRRSGGPDRRYLVNRTDHVLDGMAGDTRLRLVLPARTRVAEVAGLPDLPGGHSSVLVRDPGDWSVRRRLSVAGTVGLVASDTGSDTVCLGGEAGVTVADLRSGRVRAVAGSAGPDVTGLACPGGRPVVVRARPSDGGAVRAAVTRTAGATTVSVTGGRVDAVAARGTTVVIAVAAGGDTELVEIDTVGGGERRRARIGGLAASQALAADPAGWLLFSESTVTRVDLGTGGRRRFALPGTLLAP
ncbi:hypothetical protein [Streptomyces sp. NBC_00582]|uniref:hypothetical protein n=1 Tax=Streptomyces sp. NBC_00582 TaxID=2975783 RepID=UPI002E815779|nr:hypothetical protein [Streptomyces sp. NBC_00582]WUB63533.1 hypothetical protein OG852_25650 [Streptomyces sp. NBC_00582]